MALPEKPETIVVGIGASAGGLEALSELLTHIPEETGMAFVVVQHLDPHHESILPELLSGKARIPVTKVENETPVEPDHVYVIPPNAEMTIKDCVLKLVPRPQGPAQYRPIDAFFSSLANDRHEQAVGVVLSGSASDGTLGLQFIKGEGGITFAQDASAKFDSMPRTAIAAGAVDFVLPPYRIAEELTSIGKNARGAQVDANGDQILLQRLLLMIRTNTGVDFVQYKQPTIQRRINRRMLLRNRQSLEDYLDLVQREPDEARALFNDLLINVTEFFRDPQVFEAAKESAFPTALRNISDRESVRAWIPGCSSGEEVYSMAIAIVEYLEAKGLNASIQMFGTDVSERAIELARAAVYNESSLANVSPERLRRFFVPTEHGYQIGRSIREMCVFSYHNLAKDPPLSRMDIISCRNLLIYFSSGLQKRVISTLGYSLQPWGCLILGSSESLGSLSEHFIATDPERRIYNRKPGTSPHPFDLSERFSPYAQSPPALQWSNKSPASVTERDVLRYADDLVLSRYTPARLVVNDRLQVIQSRGALERFLAAEPVPEVDLISVLRADYRLPLTQAIEEARTTGDACKASVLGGEPESGSAAAQITVVPITAKGLNRSFLILFEEVPAGSAKNLDSAPRRTGLAAESKEITRLLQELRTSREYLQSVIEELRSSNEEAQSANEELQSTNEEVQTAKEELQSTNEELHTINAEMQGRNIELAQLNDDLVNLLSSINTPIVMTGSDLRIRRFTPMAEKVLRLLPTDIGRPISDLRPRINVENLEEIFRNVLDSLQPHEEEVRDQEGRSYLMRLRPYRTAENRIDGAVLQLLDITDLKRSLEQVNRARDYAEAIVETVRELLVVLDSQVAIRDANQSFYEFFNLTEPEALRQSIFDATRGALDLPAVRSVLSDWRSSDVEFAEVEVELKRRLHDDRVLLLKARRLKGMNEEPLLLVALEDITARKRAAEARYRRLFESARDGIVLLDAESGEIFEVNPFAVELFGYSRDELTGRKLWEVPPFEHTPELRSQLARVRDRGTIRFDTFIVRTKEGRELSAEVVASVYFENERRAIQFNIRDVTERKRFEREIQETQKLESLGLLAGGIAHDFNNLLTGVLGNASFLLSITPPDEATRLTIREIMRAAERAAFLTRQMLAYAGKGRFLNEPIDVGELVREMSSLVATSIPKTVELKLDMPVDLPQIQGDPGQVQQLVMNLLINAGEAIAEDMPGRVYLRAGRREITPEDARDLFVKEQLAPGSYVSLEVTDNGSGMDQATVARIFDPFFTTKFTGRGLGLAAVQGIVRGHRGALRVYSTPGRGTSFEVILPAIEGAIREKRRNEPLKYSGAGAVILLIDDEETIRSLGSLILSHSGFKVLIAENGMQGLEMFREHRFLISAVLLDLIMPVMGGRDVLLEMRAVSPGTPVLVMSGYDESEASRQLGDLPVEGYLAKPFDSLSLVEAVASVIARSAQRKD